MQKTTSFNTKTITLMAILIATDIVLTRFLSINTPIARIGFSFVPIVISAIVLGPVRTGVVAGLSDIIGAILLPLGTYFPGITLTAFCMGLTWGIFLHKKQSVQNVCFAVLINQLIFSLGLNSVWLSILSGTQVNVLLATRGVQVLILIPVQILVTCTICKYKFVLNKKNLF